MIPAVAQVCSLEAPLERDLEDYAAGGCQAVELWLGKAEAFLSRGSAAELRALLVRHGLSAPAASFQGGLFDPRAAAREEHEKALARRLELCGELGVETLVIAGDIAAPLDQGDIERAVDTLRRAAEAAAGRGVRLAFEFQGRAAFANNLCTAAALVAEVDHPRLGICLDLFHYYVGPSKADDLELLSAENLFHVQFCDLAGQPRELATDADRVLPGDGDLQFAPIVERLRRINYQGCVAVELMNPRIWRIPPRQLGEIAITALKRSLGE